MPRYYFHARGPNRYIPDYIGYELDDLSAAREFAFETIRDMASDPFYRGDYRRWTLYIADENGRTVLAMPFLVAL
jgi:hypothetical protein